MHNTVTAVVRHYHQWIANPPCNSQPVHLAASFFTTAVFRPLAPYKGVGSLDSGYGPVTGPRPMLKVALARLCALARFLLLFYLLNNTVLLTLRAHCMVTAWLLQKIVSFGRVRLMPAGPAHDDDAPRLTLLVKEN